MEYTDANQPPEEIAADTHKENQRDDKLLARQVARYLIQNPQFFEERMELLETIKLPRDNGKTVSLMTHQTNLLRERNIEMRQRLDQLLHNARDNDQLFFNSRRLILSLLEAENIGEVTEVLYSSFSADFNVEFTSLTLFEPIPVSRQSLGKVHTSTFADAETAIGGIIRNGRPICGVLRLREKEFLFAEDAEHIASAAVVPLANQVGALAVGSPDPQYYRSSLGTLFLSYIAEVLERLLPKLLDK
ncbi:DUF484 domain-containing protein [Microbulbifer sp. A4B17]|uniref:DUF484 family protein n=1 Tax=Microbulbifer sp. A4B17 TaxID=359370 RepID=UPI000D52BED9|nr:DUF484 family protein [Microbulbifer sp. A4B17]AWF79532.1 DUF484 domain-containing protein [Microbulbifer sp. A4B17]